MVVLLQQSRSRSRSDALTLSLSLSLSRHIVPAMAFSLSPPLLSAHRTASQVDTISKRLMSNRANVRCLFQLMLSLSLWLWLSPASIRAAADDE
jgi:hypothetical protein